MYEYGKSLNTYSYTPIRWTSSRMDRENKMPIYEYRCDACGECVEVLGKSGDRKPPTCPKCRVVKRKVLSSPAIQFKGSGWYVTDYAGKNAASGASDNGDGAKAADSGSEATPADTPKTEAAPASKIK